MATRSAAEQIASGCISSRFPAASALNDAFPDLRRVTASSGMSSRSSPSTAAITRPSRKIVSIPSTERQPAEVVPVGPITLDRAD